MVPSRCIPPGRLRLPDMKRPSGVAAGRPFHISMPPVFMPRGRINAVGFVTAC